MSFVDFDGELDTQPAFEDFSGRLDGESDSLPKRAVQDTAVDLAKGVVGFGESVVGLADLATAGSVGNALQRIGYDPKQTKSFLEGFYTEDRKTANQAVSQADGFMDTLATMGANPSTIIGSIVESLPGTIGAGAVGGAVVRRALSSAFAEAKALGLTGDALTSFMSQKATEIGAQRAAILASSVAEGAQSAGSIAEAGRQAGRDWSEYALPAAAGGAATSLINVGSTKLANKLGIGDIETDIAMRQAGAGKFASSGSFAKRVPLEAVKEGVFEEMPQSWQEQIAQNIAEGRPDIFEGAGKAAAQGLVAGAGMGGGHAALTHSAPRPADILNTPNTQQAIDTFNAAVQADVTADDDINAIGALMQDYTAANRQTLEAAQAQLDAEVDQGDPLAVANPADVTNAAALARTAQADQAIAATLSDEEQGIGIPPAAADTANLPDTSAPITGQRSLAQQVLEISRNGGPRTEAERGLMAMARRDLGEQKVAEIERLGQAPALMTRMEQKDVERGATPPITIVPNDNGVPIIRSQTPEISTAVNVELKAAGINTHTIDGTSIRVPKAQAQVAQQIVSRVNTRFTQPRQEQTLGTQAEETVPTEQGQPESQPAATLTLGNASHAQSATVRAMLGGQMSAEDHVGIIDNLDTLPTQVDANQGPRIGRPMAKTIKMLAEMLGRKVVFYETTNKEVAEGINRDGNTLYVNIDSNVDAVAVAGHEMVHSIEHEQPELYAVMLDATKALLKSGGRQRAVSYAKYAGARNIDSAARELLSDVGGNEWRSGQFWSDVFDEVHRSHAPTEARSIIAKIRDAVVAFINKLIRATPKQGFQHGYTREELAEIRDNLVKATAESFRRAERVRLGLAPTPEAKAGEVRFAGKREEDADNEPTRVFVEVAPDPNNSALTEAWRSQPYDERVAMSRSVFQKILPNVLSALGIKGEFSEQLGGYKLDTNPSFAALFDNANDAHRFSLLAGYALSQDSMMVLSGQKFDGAMDAGIIEIELPKDFTQGQVHSAYLAARGTWPGKISGHTTKDGIMHIVVPRKTALQVAMKVNKALGNKYPVHYAEGYYAFPQKKDYDYASIQGTSSAQLPGTREDASKLRAEASRLIQSELAKRGVRFSNQRQAPDAASGGLDGRGYAGNARTGISATGIHYSREQRGQLDSSFFGQGLNSEELERVRNSQDSRLRHRIYFYVNGGRGINPEQGVGAHAHQAELHHLYDLESDPRDFGLVADPNERESKILDSGYSGTIAPSRGIAVLIGPRSIPVEYKGYGRPEVAQVKGAEPSAYGKAQRALADRRDLPSGRMKGSEWQKTLPEMDLSHLDTDAYYYKDALLERPRFSKFRQVDTESPEFKRWSDNAEIVPRDSTFTKDFESEKPVVVQVIHGTAGDFTSFEKDRANPESDMGAGFYSTNDELDASANYAGEGPDLKAKLDTMADRIQDEDEFADDRIAAEAEARRRLAVRNQGFAMPVWVRFKKPFVLGGERETVLTYNEPYNEETDGYGEEAGTLVDFIVELRSVTGQFNEGSVESLVDSVLEKARDYGQVGAAELFSVMTEDEKFGYYTDDEGRLVSKEIFRQTLDNLGYDGVIDQTVNEKFGDRRKYGQKMRGVVDGTKHFIAFSPAQIKSAIANTGEFSDTNPDIRYSAPRAQPWYYSQLEQGVRTMPAKVSGTSANNVALWLKSNADKLKIKKEEVEWSGVMDYLASLGKEKVTAEQLADWVAKNGVKVEEVVLGEPSQELSLPDEWYFQDATDEGYDGQIGLYDERNNLITVADTEEAALEDAREQVLEELDYDQRTGRADGGTKHASGNLVLPGGTDHREIVLTVPTIEPYNESDSIHYGDVGKGKQIAWARVNTRYATSENDSRRKAGDNFFLSKQAPYFPSEVMESGVVSLLDNAEIRKLVVSLLPVDVMNILRVKKISPESLFSDVSIGSLLPATGEERLSISSGIVRALGLAEARLRAIVNGLPSSGGKQEILPTLRASDLSRAEVLRLIFPLNSRPESGFDGSEFGGATSGAAFGNSGYAGAELSSADRARLGDLFSSASLGAKSSGVGVTRAGVEGNTTSLANLLDWHSNLHDKYSTDNNTKKVLFVEEIQSQRNQHGRKKGFDTSYNKRADEIIAAARKENRGLTQAERDEIDDLQLSGKLTRTGDVPTAPFVSTKDGKPVDSYIPLVLKRLIAYAVDTGHDRISWTTGEQQADRYDLSKQIDAIEWLKNDRGYAIAADKDGRTVIEKTGLSEADLVETIGKEPADRIINSGKPSGKLSGLDLKVGGGWTASMYGDSRGLDAKGKPSMIAAAARKLGAEVGVVDIDQTPKGGVLHFRAASEGGTYRAAEEKALMQQPGFTITPAMQEQASKGMPLFSKQRIIGDSGRQYTNEQKDLFKHVGREVDEKTTLEKLKSWIGKNWAQGLFDQFAPVKSLSNHAYTLMRLSKGATGAFEAFMRHGKLSIRDGAYDADTSGGVIDQVFIPLGKETTDFLYWIAGNRAERLVAEDREHLFTQAHIAAAKSLATGDTDFDYTLSNGTVTRKRALIFRDALKKFNDFSKNALDMAEQSGLIDGASRQYWEHEFYVPFYRVADEKDGGIRGMNIKQGVVRQKAFEMLKGGEEKLGDLLSNTLMNWAHLIDASAKNRAAKTTIDAAVNLGAARKAVAGEKNVVWYSDKGRKAEFVVDDPALLVALNGLEYAGLRGPAMDALSATKHWLTMGVTASPFFKVRNLIRDSIQSIAVSDLSYNPLHNVKEGWKLTNRASQEYVSALAGGGLIRFGTMLEGSEAARTRQLIKQGSKDSHILDGEGKLQAFYDKVIEPAWSKYQELGNRGEEINRMALYDKLIAEGKTHAEAALAARDLMDFSMSGAFTSVRFLTQVVPFLNARLQGLYKLGKGAKEDKARFAIVMAATALAGLAMMGYASGDDDRWKRWKKREQWDKDNYWMFSFGDVDYRIPKPFEIGAMATLVERGFETAFMLGDEKNKWSKFGQAVLKIAGDQLSMNPVPQLAKPILDIYANKDSFSGRPIETMSMERLKKDYRFSASTSMLARGASTAGNAVASVAGMEFLSPVQIDHLVRSYFGWVGTASVASADFMLRPMTNEPSRPEKDMLKWMSGGMVTDKDSAGSRYVSHLYDQLGELESAYGTWQQLRKEGKVDDAREFAADHRDELRQYRQSENVKQRLSEMNKQIRMIERSDRHPAEKRILINRIRARQSDMAERLN